MDQRSSEYIIVLPDGTSVYSDGCTGLPEWIIGHARTICCVEHDRGGSDQALQNCWNSTVANDAPAVAGGAAILFAFLITVMKIGRPVYEWAIRHGLTKTEKVKK